LFLGTGVKAGATPQNSKNFHDIRFKTSKHKFVYKGDFIMVSKELVLTNAQGFHMRPASVFATAMGKYSCDVTIKFNGNQYNAKSLLNIIAACIKCGSEIEVVCDGADENEALAEAVQLIESGLGE
jgi:phosphocarrier protein HPr